MTYIFAANSMDLRSLVFTELCFKVEPSESKTASVKTEIATQGHSRSFILQSVTSQQGVAYHHIILLASSLKFPKK